jgi:prolyl oligopeptidase
MTVKFSSYLVSTLALGALVLSACSQDNSDTTGNADMMDKAAGEAPAEEMMAKDIKMEDDPYLWLEEVEGEDALTWVRGQNERSLGELESDPRYQTLFEDAKAILNSEDRIASASLRGGYAYNFWQDDDNKRGLWRRMTIANYVSGGKEWETLLDIDKLAEDEGENWVYKGSSCLEPEYTKCMVTVSRGGSDASVRREFDITTKSFVEDGYKLDEAKAGTAWVSDDLMLIGYPVSEGEVTDSGYPRIVRAWPRGSAFADQKPIFEGEKTDVGIWPFAGQTQDKTYAGIVRAITFYESEYYLLDLESMAVRQIPLPAKAEISGFANEMMIVSLQQNWQFGDKDYKTGSIIAYNPDDDSSELVFEPADRQAVNGVATSEDAIYINLLDNIVGKVLRYNKQDGTWQGEKIDLPDAGVVSVSSVDGKTGDALLYFENPTTPETLYFLKGNSDAPKPLQSTPAFFDTKGMVTKQYSATSKDGTEIPYFVTAKQSVLDAGPAPTIQYGYGGFQISILPNYSGITGKLWLERGGVYVIANIRGGGEFGPEWHQAALKQNRQLAYDDFFAISEDLIAKGITTPEKLGIVGRSNGGLLMGVAMVQRPDLYKAITIGVPLLDMLRYDKLLAGASWVGEYGDPDLAEDRPHLEALSPYQNLKADEDYPRPFFYTSTKDDRVHPGHARKMAAKMEGYGKDFLYYENIEGGHAGSANQDQYARIMALQYVYFARSLMD